MKKRKKFTFVALVLVLILSGCSFSASSGSSSSSKKITLTLWYWNRSIDDQLLKKAEEQFPNIKLVTQKIGGDFKSKLKTTLAAKSGEPDIVALNDWIMELFPSQDRFYDLYELGAAEVQDDYLEWKWQQGVTPEGHMIGFPMDTGPTALFYREDLFKEAGLPSDPEEVHQQMSTWEEYREAGLTLKEAFGGKVFMYDNIENVYNEIISQSANKYFTPEGDFIGDSNEVIREAWDTSVAFHNDGLIASADHWTPEWNAGVNKGKIASFVGAVWMKQPLQEAAPDTAGKWRVTRAPGGDGNVGGSFMAIPKSSKHPKEAFEVIKWLQNPENQMTMLKTTNLFPSTVDAFDSEVIREEEPFFGGQATGEVFAESAQNVKVSFFGERYPAVHGVMTRWLNNITSLKQSTAFDEAMQRVERELKR